jgi:hypothetical protein
MTQIVEIYQGFHMHPSKALNLDSFWEKIAFKDPTSSISPHHYNLSLVK